MTPTVRSLIALTLVFAACSSDGTPSETPSPVTIQASAPEKIQGNVLDIVAAADGLNIVKADGDTTGKSGHWHVLVDREPPEVGGTIPAERGIVHSAVSPIRVWGLAPGFHTIQVVLGDGQHQRLDAEPAILEVEVEGPSVEAEVKSKVLPDQPFTLNVLVSGLELVAADGSTGSETGHLHAFIDPADPPTAGMVIPKPEDGSIVHFATDTVEIKGLTAGEHTIYVVAGDGTHTAFDPLIGDKITVSVSE